MFLHRLDGCDWSRPMVTGWEGTLDRAVWLLLASLCSSFIPGTGQGPFRNESLIVTGVDLSPWGHLFKHPGSCVPGQRTESGPHGKSVERDRLKSLLHYNLSPDRTAQGIVSSYTEPRTLVQVLRLHLGVEFIFYDLTWPDLTWGILISVNCFGGEPGHVEAR